MSLYSLDSLERGSLNSEKEESFESSTNVVEVISYRSLETVSLIEIPSDALEAHRVIGNRRGGETRNPLIASAVSQAGSELLLGLRSPDESQSIPGHPSAPTSAGVVNSPLSISKRTSRHSNSALRRRESSRTTASTGSVFKNDKKLGNVLAPLVIEAKPKPKTYLERYRERLGVPARVDNRSPEGSTLSIFGDTSYEPITDVDSRPPTTTPRDDQSELSFYRRLIDQSRTTRSWDVENRSNPNGDLRSISDFGLLMNGGKKRLSYRPYNVRDYECLTVPRADRSLGPDTVEIRAKWEKLMRRTRYGELASSRNRRNVVRRSELCKSKRTNVQKHTVEFPLTEDGAVVQIVESKNFGETSRNPNPPAIPRRLKKALQRTREPTVRSPNYPKNSTKSDRLKSSQSSPTSSEKCHSDYSLEDLQHRHQNEKRLMDLLINRTLLH